MVNVKDPTVSLSKCRRTIAGTMSKFQIPALTYKGHCIRDTAVPSANYANCSHVLHIKEKEGCKNEQNVHLTMLTTESSRQEADVIFHKTKQKLFTQLPVSQERNKLIKLQPAVSIAF